MPQTIRVATFNVENLFSRAKIINLRDHSVATDALTKVAELDKLLRQDPYSPADKAAIVALYDELKTYISIREDREKLFNKAKTKVVASGASDWDGVIEFRRAKFSEAARLATAKVIKTVKADIAFIIEAEDRVALREFNSELLGTRKFKFPMLIDGNDQRGIDVGVLTNFPLKTIHTHMFEKSGNTPTFPRDCLHLEVELPNGQPLHLFANHFTSKSQGVSATDPKRERQANRVAEILDAFDLNNDFVIVAGDLNDTPNRSPLQPLIAKPGLSDVLDLQFGGNMPSRWTYFYQTAEQIDYLLVSKPLKDAFVKAGVERRGIFDLATKSGGTETSWSEVTSNSDAASDHGAIWAEFSI